MDYYGDRYAYIGIQRNGPDLANAGWRFDDAKSLHEHLYNPQQFNNWSTMPSYRHLYTERPIQGLGSEEALDIKGDRAPEDGFEIVPTDDARSLVDYLMTLKRDGAVPLTPKEKATAEKAAEEPAA